MLSFITGSPKSGKTTEIIERISRDLSEGKKVLLLVPEQEAVAAERRLIGSQSSSDALFSLEVTNFRRLPNTVFRALGGLCYNYIDKGGQALIMWRVLCELSPELSVFKKGDNTDIGLISSLISLYSQLADYGITPDKLERAASEIADSSKGKAEDLALLYTRYDALIHESFDSSKDDLVKVAELIRDREFFKDTSVYIDSFTGFTPCELEVIKALISINCELTLSLCIDRERDDELFENLISIMNKLCEYASDYSVDTREYFCTSPKRIGEFEHLAKNIFDSASAEVYSEPTKALTCCVAPDIYSECEMVIADIVKHIKAGMRCRDISIICGNSQDYYGVLDVMMQRHNIPCRFSMSNDVLQTRCVKFIISALNILIYNWRSSDIITYIKTGFCPINDEEAEIIEEYVSTWSVSGSLWTMEEDWMMNPEGYTSHLSSRSVEILDTVNDVRYRISEPLISLRDSLRQGRSGEEAAYALYEFLCANIAPECLEGDEIASWNAVISALEQLSLCLSGETIPDLETLKRVLRLVCSQISFSLMPASADEISCSSISSLRTCEARRIYLIGANEGSFPGEMKESNIIDDRLRKTLCDKGLTMPHDPDELYREENYLFYKALLSAHDSVMITRAASTLDGTEKVACGSLGELMRIFPKLSTRNFEELDIYDLVYDRVSAIDRIDDELYGEAIRALLRDEAEYTELMTEEYSPLSTVACSIKEEKNLERLKGDMPLSQTRIESFVKCKFAYQLEYNLKLNEQARIEYDPRDIGNFIHKILEDYFKQTKGKERLSDEERREVVDRIVDSYIADTCGNMKRVSKRLLAFFEKLRRNAHLFVRDIYEEFEDSDFEPKFFEMNISTKETADLPPYRIMLSDGSSVYINGQIDRVDAFERDGNVYFRVIDYKTGKKEFDVRELSQGINLQMFLYLFSILENKERFLELLSCKGELVPSGVLYYMAKIIPETYSAPKESSVLERSVISRIARKGMVLADEDVINAMSHSQNKSVIPDKVDIAKGKGPIFTSESLEAIRKDIDTAVREIAEGIKRGEADAIPNKKLNACDFCRMGNICRRKSMGGDESE